MQPSEYFLRQLVPEKGNTQDDARKVVGEIRLVHVAVKVEEVLVHHLAHRCFHLGLAAAVHRCSVACERVLWIQTFPIIYTKKYILPVDFRS